MDGGRIGYRLDDIHLPFVPLSTWCLRNRERAGTYGRGVFAFVKPAGPSIAVDLEHGLQSGTVCEGPQYLDVGSLQRWRPGFGHQ